MFNRTKVIAMKILQAMLITIYCCRHTQGQGSCVAAGYFDCCRDFIDAPNGTIFSSLTCQDPVEGGSCFCDFACHRFLDCCEDINRICPNSTCASAGYSSCCTNGSCKTSGGCYCDFHCHSVGDCCPDISEICPRNESDHNGQTQLTSRPQLVAVTMVTGNEIKKLSHPGMVGTRELISWILVAVLLSMLITVITVMAIKIIYMRKKTASRDIDQPDISQDCKMEGNPCYETVTLRQITASAHQAHAHDYQEIRQPISS